MRAVSCPTGRTIDDLYRRAAVYVDKILKGAKPADLPVQQATKFEFVINLKAAKQIGLTLSPEFLSRANQVSNNFGFLVCRAAFGFCVVRDSGTTSINNKRCRSL